MQTYKITIKLAMETRAKAIREIEMRVPNGKICTVRKDNGLRKPS